MNSRVSFPLIWLSMFSMLLGCAPRSTTMISSTVPREALRQNDFLDDFGKGLPSGPSVQGTVEGLVEGDLTAETASQIAVLNSPHLKSVYEEIGIARADLVQAGLLKNPIFDGEVKVTEMGEDAVLEMALKQDFLDFSLIPLKKRMAQAELEKTRLRVAGEILSTIASTKRAFYSLQASEQELEMMKQVQEALEASFQMGEQIHEAGNLTDLDLMNQKALFEQSKIDMEAAELAVLENRQNLNRQLGFAEDEIDWSAEPRLPDPPDLEMDTTDLVQTALANSLDLKMDWYETRMIAARLGITKIKAPLPELMLGVASEREPGNEWSVGPSIGLQIPIFDQGQARIARNNAELQRAWHQYKATAVEIVSQVKSAKYRLEASRSRLDQYQNVMLPLFQDIMDQTQKRYNGMLLGVFQLLETKRQQIDTERKYIFELLQYWTARTDLETILTGKLAGASGGPAMESPSTSVAASGNGGH